MINKFALISQIETIEEYRLKVNRNCQRIMHIHSTYINDTRFFFLFYFAKGKEIDVF